MRLFNLSDRSDRLDINLKFVYLSSLWKFTVLLGDVELDQVTVDVPGHRTRAAPSRRASAAYPTRRRRLRRRAEPVCADGRQRRGTTRELD